MPAPVRFSRKEPIPRPRCPGWTTPSTRPRTILRPGLHVPDDHPRTADHHPGIGGQIEADPAPLGPEEVHAQDDLPGLIELVGDEHVGHYIEVAQGRRPEPVPSGELHAPQRTAPISMPGD
jgi:hypothetical protein